MCCFSRAVRSVGGTQIFARRLDEVRQALVYSMSLTFDEPLAMVLPLPVVSGGGDDAVAFVDLSAYPRFFTDLESLFPDPPRQSFGGIAAAANIMQGLPLVVHVVGDFVASYVPSRRDFARLDERFRMPAGVFDSHAEYADWGFAVFQLAPRMIRERPKKKWYQLGRRDDAGGDGEQTVHPMALAFPSRRPDALFFPTLHVHDGAKVPATAKYDHSLYCQTDDEVLAKTFAWRPSAMPLGDRVDVTLTKDLVDGTASAYRRRLFGDQPNIDHWFAAPRCALASLTIRGESFACDLAGVTAFDTQFADAKQRRRHDTSRERLDAVSTGLRAGLEKLVAERGAAWHLGRMRDNVRSMHLSNWEPHEFTSTAIVKIAPGTPGPFEIQIPGEGDSVETQNVRFVFEVAPSREDVLAIRAAIGAILDASVGAGRTSET